ncbi:toxin-activating lysine-acyltransferase, partial [Xanthomonas campestris]
MQPNAVDAQALGLAMQLLFKTDRKRFSIAAAYVWLWPAIRLGQLVTIEDEDGVWT